MPNLKTWRGPPEGQKVLFGCSSKNDRRPEGIGRQALSCVQDKEHNYPALHLIKNF